VLKESPTVHYRLERSAEVGNRQAFHEHDQVHVISYGDKHDDLAGFLAQLNQPIEGQPNVPTRDASGNEQEHILRELRESRASFERASKSLELQHRFEESPIAEVSRQLDQRFGRSGDIQGYEWDAASKTHKTRLGPGAMVNFVLQGSLVDRFAATAKGEAVFLLRRDDPEFIDMQFSSPELEALFGKDWATLEITPLPGEATIPMVFTTGTVVCTLNAKYTADLLTKTYQLIFGEGRPANLRYTLSPGQIHVQINVKQPHQNHYGPQDLPLLRVFKACMESKTVTFQQKTKGPTPKMTLPMKDSRIGTESQAFMVNYLIWVC
jgi:hypothetical protein